MIENLLLGKHAHFAIGVADIQVAWTFYHQLGFQKQSEGKEPVAWMSISDDSVHILLSETDKPYIGLEYYTSHLNKVLRELEKRGFAPIPTVEVQGQVVQAIVASPNDIPITLVQDNGLSGVDHDQTTLLDIAREDLLNAEVYPNASCGAFGEFSISVTDMDEAIEAWAKLGFIPTERHKSPYEWAIVSDGASIIGLHVTEEFTEPAITYFSPDMEDKLVALEASGLEIEFLGNRKSGKLLSPDGNQIFLFSF